MASHLVVRACPPFRVPVSSGDPLDPASAAATAAAASLLESDARSLLDGPELDRAWAMTARTREDFLAGRLAQRRFAAGLLGVPASALTAWYSCPRCGAGTQISHGRPGYLIGGAAAPLLLSLSRAAGWTLLAGIVDPEPGLRLGIDVEDPARTGFEGFDAVVLTPAERAHLAGLTGTELFRARARLWARKEAWLKMTGTGLQTAPDTVDVFDDAPDDVLEGDVNGRAGLRDLPPAEAGLPGYLVAAVAVAVYP
ncbi:4'-phosphopantetheinyl transferase family protein [Arthrobacter sp. H-02-3]|uniref:4'-phosphopantetheinyl transferase family protein n=1 Tax=Arthrobacter sp. H-02-3 TaxID=2703675 RepID=UPI000DD2722F|nr:4'-phosphopantetheinyl transferase superfamily protein [Arthrobacter sp. H-02-3]PVZ54458.1 4-phosphopantetheinyl transferase [Arthrobacter sp. H-02-3]